MNNPATPRLPRRRALAAAATATAAALLGACSSGTASRSLASASAGGAPLVIGMTYTPNIQFAPFYMASYADGTQLRHHGAQEGQFEALLAGAEQSPRWRPGRSARTDPARPARSPRPAPAAGSGPGQGAPATVDSRTTSSGTKLTWRTAPPSASSRSAAAQPMSRMGW